MLEYLYRHKEMPVIYDFLQMVTFVVWMERKNE